MGNKSMGIGDWGWGPIPNPQSPFYSYILMFTMFTYIIYIEFIIELALILNLLVIILSDLKMMKQNSDRKFKKKENSNKITDNIETNNDLTNLPEEFDLQYNTEKTNKTTSNNSNNTNISKIEGITKPIPIPIDESSIYNAELFDLNNSFKSIGV